MQKYLSNVFIIQFNIGLWKFVNKSLSSHESTRVCFGGNMPFKRTRFQIKKNPACASFDSGSSRYRWNLRIRRCYQHSRGRASNLLEVTVQLTRCRYTTNIPASIYPPYRPYIKRMIPCVRSKGRRERHYIIHCRYRRGMGGGRR